MAGSCACQNPHQNLLSTGKDEFAGAASIKGGGTLTSHSAMSSAFTPYFAIKIVKTYACNRTPQHRSPVKRASNKRIIDKPNSGA